MYSPSVTLSNRGMAIAGTACVAWLGDVSIVELVGTYGVASSVHVRWQRLLAYGFESFKQARRRTRQSVWTKRCKVFSFEDSPEMVKSVKDNIN